MRPIWKRSDVDPTKQYVLLLILGPSGQRDCELREVARRDEPVLDGERAFVTELIPDFDPILRGDKMEIAKRVRLTNGQRFDFDSHGGWYTEDEAWDPPDQRGWVRALIARLLALARKVRRRQGEPG